MPGFPTQTVGTPTKQGESPALQSQRRPLRKAAATTQRQSEEATEVLAHLVLPVGPVVATLGTPIVQMMVNAFAGENFGETVGRAAVFPRAGAGGDVDVASGEVAELPGVVEIREIVYGIIEIKVVVVHAVHEILHVVDAGHGEAALNHIGMLEERIGGVICAEGSAHGGDG